MTAPSATRALHRGGLHGFTLIELVAAITIVGLLLAATVPASARFYQSIQYRQAIRDVITILATARYKAVNTGRAQDVAVDPTTKVLRRDGETLQLPEGFKLAVHSARELNKDAQGVIRFYPEGGSSGGDIDISRPSGNGVKISVDWLVGSVSQKKYVFD